MSARRNTHGALLVLGLAMLLPACADFADEATAQFYCLSDDDCSDPFVCVFGACYDPASAALQRISLEVVPASSSGQPTQQFRDFVVSGQARSEVQLQATVHAYFGLSNATDQPLAGLLTAESEGSIPGRSLRADHRTGEDGAADLTLTVGQSYSMRVLPEDPAQVPFHPAPIFANADIDGVQNTQQLRGPDADSLTTLSGRAVVAIETPDGLPDLRVQLRGLVGSQPQRRVVSTTATSSSAEADRGRFEILLPELLNSDLQLRIAPTSANPYFPVVEIDGIDLSGDIDLGPVAIGNVGSPLQVHGQVRGPEGPVVGAALTFVGEVGQGNYSASAVTAGDGSYQIELLPGSYEAVVSPPSTSPAGLTALIEPVLIDRPPAGVDAVDFVTQPRARLQGLVLDGSGSPVPGAVLRATRQSSAPESLPSPADDVHSVFESRTDLNGRYSLRVDPGLFEIAVIPPRDALVPRRTDLLTVGLIDLPRDIQLFQTAPFGARVLAEDGSSPVLGALVRAFLVLEDQRVVLVGEEITNELGEFGMALPSFDEPASEP